MYASFAKLIENSEKDLHFEFSFVRSRKIHSVLGIWINSNCVYQMCIQSLFYLILRDNDLILAAKNQCQFENILCTWNIFNSDISVIIF